MQILEQVACDIFRLVSAQVHGTPLNMKVDPYKIKLNAIEPGVPVDVESPANIDPSIKADVDLMWFYPMPKYATAPLEG